jgi:hypothetical protein
MARNSPHVSRIAILAVFMLSALTLSSTNILNAHALLTTTPTPRPVFEMCKPPPTATSTKKPPTTVPSKATVSVDTSTPVSTNTATQDIITTTAIPDTATPYNITPTAIPVGRKPADALLILRPSRTLLRSGSACVEVYAVTWGGPADVAGIHKGDLILGVDKIAIRDLGDFYNAIVAHKAGDVVKITVQRDADQIPLNVTLGLNPIIDPNATDTPTITVTATATKKN